MSRWIDAPGPSRLARWSRRPLVEAALLALLALTINLAGNGRVSLWDRDEPRYAQATREMRERGDWIRPSFNGEPRHHKPILIYWLMGAATMAAGDNPFGVRLVSALAGAGTVLLTWHLGRSLFGPRAGRLAALVLATAPLMAVESKMSTIDATLTCLLMGCQVLLWRLIRGPSLGAALGFWALLALAFLAKGPVAPALLVVAGLASAWWGGSLAFLGRLRWRAGLGLFLVLVLPWYAAIGILTHGEFYQFAVGSQIVDRVAKGMEEHGAFPGFYILTLLGTFYPWSALLPAALLAAWRRRREAPAFAFLLGWVVGPWILLECVQTKLVHYYLPALPACALLVGWLVDWLAAGNLPLRSLRLGRPGFGLLAIVGSVLAVGLVVGLVKFPAPMRAPLAGVLAIIAAGTATGAVAIWRGATLRACHTLVATWALAVVLVGGWLLPAAEPYRASRRVAEKLREWGDRERAEPVLATYQQPSVIYRYGAPIPVMKNLETLGDRVESGEVYVSALERKEFRLIKVDPRIEITVLETIEGFNIDKGRNETLHISRIDLRREGRIASAPAGEQIQIK